MSIMQRFLIRLIPKNFLYFIFQIQVIQKKVYYIISNLPLFLISPIVIFIKAKNDKYLTSELHGNYYLDCDTIAFIQILLTYSFCICYIMKNAFYVWLTLRCHFYLLLPILKVK